MIRPLVIAAFRMESEAAEARNALAGHGIAAESSPRNPALERIGPDIFEGGFDVIVDSDDAERAVAVLRRLWPEVIEVAPAERCAACGSTDLYRLPRLRLFLGAATILLLISVVAGQQELFLLATAIIGFVLLLAPNRRCRTCGERWSGKARATGRP